MTRHEAVIFDLDGTLLDTLQDLASSVNSVLESLGCPAHPLDSYRFFVGDGMDQLVEKAFPRTVLAAETQGALVSRVKEEYSRRWAETTVPYPGIPGLLDFLEARGVPMAIFSNKPHHFALLTVESLLSRWPFRAVYGIGPGMPRKPDPYGALLIASELGLEPERIVYLGDTATDMKTARAAGMFPAGALWGFRPAEELNEAGASFLAASPADLKKFFGGEHSV